MSVGGASYDVGDLLPPVRDVNSFDSKLFAVPFYGESSILMYNKEVLDKAGITPPQTIDELIAAAKKLTQGNVKGLFLGNDGGAGLMGGPMLWSAGLDYLTKDNQFGFDDPRAATALGKLREMWDAKVLLLGAGGLGGGARTGGADVRRRPGSAASRRWT